MDNGVSAQTLARLGDRKIYSFQMNPPPAEKLDHVIQFELTTGCSYGGCGFCTMYKGQPHNVRTLPEFQEHVDKVWGGLNETREGRATIRGLKRIFIGGGNALRVDTGLLQEAINYTILTFRENVRDLPRRIAVYGNTRDIIEKGKRDYYKGPRNMTGLNCGGVCGNCSIDRFGSKRGLDLVYWGVESGSDEVLSFASKGYNQSEVIEAAEILNQGKVDVSAMIITGLGGKRLSKSHVTESIRALEYIQPKFVTFIGIKAEENTRYSLKMQAEQKQGINRPLHDYELIEQMAEVISHLQSHTIVGCHGPDIHKFGFNPIDFGSVELDYRSRDDLVEKLRTQAASLKRNS